MSLPKEIFKAYDIRGVVDKTLTPTIVESIARAIGSEALDRNVKALVIGRDGRHSGPDLARALAAGIQSTGVEVIDLGMVATGMLYYATYELGTGSGVMVTGSHNPPDYNGLKMMLGGETLYGDTITALRTRIERGDLRSGQGGYRTHDIGANYLARIVGDIKLARPLNIAVDCGNGVAGAFAPALFRQLGCRVRELFCEVDGAFPNHHPDPARPENLQDLIATLRATDAELGLAFDGDGDRLGVVTKDGQIIYPDRQMMLYAADVLSRNPGATIIYDVKSTRNLGPWISRHGGKPLLWKTGHSLIKAKLKETGAALGGEMSGHVFFKDRWFGFDDALYVGARLLEILARHADTAAVLNALPDAISTPELHLHCAEGEHYSLIDQLKRDAKFPDAANIIDIDGLRVEYADGFGLMRASNTTPIVVLRFEADSDAAIKRIQAQFRGVLLAAKPDAKLPF